MRLIYIYIYISIFIAITFLVSELSPEIFSGASENNIPHVSLGSVLMPEESIIFMSHLCLIISMNGNLTLMPEKVRIYGRIRALITFDT